MVISLRERDGIWFPDVATLHKGPQRELATTWVVESATFNRPEHKQTFSLTDIGVEPGMAIHPQGAAAERAREDPSFRPRVWDGTKAVTDEEFMKALRAGKVKYGPTFEYLRQFGRSPHHDRPSSGRRAVGPSVGSINAIPSEWEQYVTEFIRKYKLTEEQSQKALAILKTCQEQAQRHLTAKKVEIDKLERRLKEARQSNDAAALKERTAAEEGLAKLRKPIETIFEKQLKPRLEKLPTRAQRKAAQKDETSKGKKKDGH